MQAHYNKHGNRGKWLENVINITNKMYEHKGVAIINKIPTPTTYKTKNGSTSDVKFTGKSTVDFTGVYKTGQFIAFDTKEVQGSNFPFKNLADHQEKYLLDVRKMKGIAFLLIFFRDYNELYVLHIEAYKELKENIDRKSIPYSYFKENLEAVESNHGYYFNYLNDSGD